MPSYVDPSACTGCKTCMDICPNDLMLTDPDAGKAFNQEPEACWECYSCVKACPHGAVAVRAYADFAPLGGACVPVMSAGFIAWTVRFRNGESKHFRFPVRTTPEGSIKPLRGLPEPGNLDDSLLCTECSLPVPAAVSDEACGDGGPGGRR
ncbi:MAG: adenylyl-sulfate reductase subunit beta [Desulfovibrio sp.]|jgi:adenylylsulfate reductase subunit B|nr:adenylyl-sulfate reductase subunit beta [Desulfovibrio sp.]